MARKILLLLLAPFAALFVFFAVSGLLNERVDLTADYLPFMKDAPNRFPILLHHGFLPVTGMHRFARDLRRRGINAYATQVSAANSIEFRARQLAENVDYFIAKTHSPKVSIIAYSMGGLDARYLISSLGYADKIASLTTIATPHRAGYLADFFNRHGNIFLSAGLTAAGVLAVPGSGLANLDFKKAGENLSTSFLRDIFNPNNPDAAQVFYQSWAAAVEGSSPRKVSLILRPTWSYINQFGLNDGIVALEAAKWGRFRGVLPTDHFSLIDSRVPFVKNDFDAFSFFGEVAASLIEAGF